MLVDHSTHIHSRLVYEPEIPSKTDRKLYMLICDKCELAWFSHQKKLENNYCPYQQFRNWVVKKKFKTV